MMLKWVLTKYGAKICTAFVILTILSLFSFLNTVINFRVPERWGISWLAKWLLASQHRVFCGVSFFVSFFSFSYFPISHHFVFSFFISLFTYLTFSSIDVSCFSCLFLPELLLSLLIYLFRFSVSPSLLVSFFFVFLICLLTYLFIILHTFLSYFPFYVFLRASLTFLCSMSFFLPSFSPRLVLSAWACVCRVFAVVFVWRQLQFPHSTIVYIKQGWAPVRQALSQTATAKVLLREINWETLPGGSTWHILSVSTHRIR